MRWCDPGVPGGRLPGHQAYATSSRLEASAEARMCVAGLLTRVLGVRRSGLCLKLGWVYDCWCPGRKEQMRGATMMTQERVYPSEPPHTSPMASKCSNMPGP